MLVLYFSVIFYNNRADIIYKQKIHILTNCTHELKDQKENNILTNYIFRLNIPPQAHSSENSELGTQSDEMLGCKRLGHAISKLIIRRCELKRERDRETERERERERALKNTFLDKVVVDFHMFGLGMQNRIGS